MYFSPQLHPHSAAKVHALLRDPHSRILDLSCGSGSLLERLAAKEEAKKEAYLKLKGFKVVGSMENPPTNPDAVKAAGGKC